MAEDRFANIFTASVIMTAANALTFGELNFGISLRDRIAIVIDQLFFYVPNSILDDMTTLADQISMALCASDQITSIFSSGLGDRRIIFMKEIQRQDFGTAASATFLQQPLEVMFTPPMIVLPNRLFIAMDTNGLATPGSCVMRMHFRTVKISQDDQLIEVLEAFQLSS